MGKKPVAKPSTSAAKSKASKVATASRARTKNGKTVRSVTNSQAENVPNRSRTLERNGKTPSRSSKSTGEASSAKDAEYAISVVPPAENPPWAKALLSTRIQWTSQKPMCPFFNPDGTWTNRCSKVRTIAGAAHDGRYNPDGWTAVEAMLRAGVPADDGPMDGCTALIFAVAQLLEHAGSKVAVERLHGLIRLLLERGASFDSGEVSARRLLEDAIANFVDWKIALEQPYAAGGPLANLHFLSTVLLRDESFFKTHCEDKLQIAKPSDTPKSEPAFLVKRADGEYNATLRRKLEPNERTGYMIGMGKYPSLQDANAFVRRYWDGQQGLDPSYWDQYSVYKNQHGCLKIYTVDHKSDPHIVWVERADHVLKWVQIE